MNDNELNLPKDIQDGTNIEPNKKRIPRSDRQDKPSGDSVGGRNEEATLLLRGSYGKPSKVEGRNEQELIIEEYAKKEGIWFGDSIELEPEIGTYIHGLGSFANSGTESQVYINTENPLILRKVIQVTNPLDINRGNDKNSVLDFLNKRIALHNIVAKSVPYKLIGFGKNENGDFVAVVEQPHILESRLATHKEIYTYYTSQGWEAKGKRSFENENYISTDVKPANVLIDKSGNIHLIDTQLDFKNESFDTSFLH